MTSTEELIIGFEDTPGGRDALALGGVLARQIGATPLVATVLSYPRNLLGPAELERALAAETAESFALARDELADLGPKTEAIAGRSPAEALSRLAEAEGAALIVVGSAERTRLRRLRPGRVGTGLLHGAPCAVAVAPGGYAEAERRLRRVGVAFDGSPEAWSALETGIELARRVGAELVLITVCEPPTAGFAEVLNTLTAEELFAACLADSRSIQELGLTRVAEDVRVDARLEEGQAAERIVAASAELDLLLLGSRGYGPLRRTLLGSVSRAVVGDARCPVLVLPRAAGTDPLGLRREVTEKPRERAAA